MAEYAANFLQVALVVSPQNNMSEIRIRLRGKKILDQAARQAELLDAGKRPGGSSVLPPSDGKTGRPEDILAVRPLPPPIPGSDTSTAADASGVQSEAPSAASAVSDSGASPSVSTLSPSTPSSLQAVPLPKHKLAEEVVKQQTGQASPAAAEVCPACGESVGNRATVGFHHAGSGRSRC